eukprot:SAG31_NODE_3228_length_4517_cov_2.643730_3_plen_122_part_00
MDHRAVCTGPLSGAYDPYVRGTAHTPLRARSQLARMARGGVQRAPADLKSVVKDEAEAIAAELDCSSPAVDATQSDVPDKFAGQNGLSRMLTPRSTQTQTSAMQKRCAGILPVPSTCPFHR